MQPDPHEEASRWWKQAVRDLDDARYLAAGERHNLACFHAQQAAEKALKAFLYHHGAESVLGHSAAVLCRQAAKWDPSFSGLVPVAAPLDRNYIPTRYPNGLPGGLPYEAFNQAAAEEALRQAQAVLDAVAPHIEGNDPDEE